MSSSLTTEKVTSVNRDILKTICSKLAENGDQSIIITANVSSRSCMFVASQAGKKLLSEKIDLVEKFIQCCHDIYQTDANLTADEILNNDRKNGNAFEGSEIDTGGEIITETFAYEYNDYSDNLSKLKNFDMGADKVEVTPDHFGVDNSSQGNADGDSRISRENKNASDNETQNSIINQSHEENAAENDSAALYLTSALKLDIQNKNSKLPERSGSERDDCNKSVTSTQNSSNTVNNLEKFRCPECGKMCSRSQYLGSHMILIHGIRCSPCKYCGKMFISTKHLGKHKKRKHEYGGLNTDRPRGIEEGEIYGNADQTFDDKGENTGMGICYTKELVKNTQDNIIEQDFNDHEYSQKNDPDLKQDKAINSDEIVHIGEDTFVCQFCNTQFKYTHTLKRHLINVHSINKSLIEPDLDDRMQVKCEGDSKVFVCKICNSEFRMLVNLKRHLKIKHPQKMVEAPLVCKVCNSEFKWKLSLKIHLLEKHQISESELNEDQSVSTEVMKKNNTSELFVCGVCNKEFKSKHNMVNHMAVSHKKNRQNDDVIDKQNKIYLQENKTYNLRKSKGEIERSSDLVKDCVKKESDEPKSCDQKASISEDETRLHSRVRFVCPHCKNAYLTGARLRKHLISVHKMHRYVCEHCGNIYKTLLEIKKHYHGSDYRPKPPRRAKVSYRCSICRKYCFNESALLKHKQMHASGKACFIFKCHHCGKIFRKSQYLSEHLRRMHSEKGLVCSLCASIFHTKDELALHRETCRSNGSLLSESCKVCGKVFENAEESKSHYNVHTSQSQYYLCEFCGKPFKSKQSMIVHVRHHTGERPYKCDTCGKAYAKKSLYQRHVETHTSSRPFQCDQCGDSFKFKYDLAAHMKKYHSGDIKSYNCEYCDRKFMSREGYNNHLLNKHLELIDFSKVNFKFRKCEFCGKLFGQKHLYETHIRRHTGDKPISCDVCDKTYTSVSELNKHKLVHDAVKRYLCNICDSGVTSMSKLKKHFKTQKHKENCKKLGIPIAESMDKYTASKPKKRYTSNLQRWQSDRKEEESLTNSNELVNNNDMHLFQPTGADYSSSDPQIADCVIITVPDNVTIATEDEADISYNIVTETATQSIINLQ